ncbi:MAG: homoserine O-acetyltransferase, partial [Planctomycetaceae bacterium]|nr:homoserine O-acetyltransferase [Planctomycetaceae bacterium]
MTSEVIDSESTAGPADSVGCVTTQTVTLFEPPHELSLACGERLGPVQVAFETYGTLNETRDNAVFICHALTGDAHAAGLHQPDDDKPGWWDSFIGPGRGIDTSRCFVICANILGGCQGTTGPGSLNLETGRPWGMSFPVVTVADIVKVHVELLRHLGIERVLAVVGGSLGGMQVLEWAASYPDRLRSAVVIASAARLSAQGIAFNTVGRRAICADPQFAGGDFYQTEG